MNPHEASSLVSPWRRSSYCHGGECAEVAQVDGMVALRSSNNPHSVVRYTADEWEALVKAIKKGEFDLG
jgi:hypothetical protein